MLIESDDHLNINDYEDNDINSYLRRSYYELFDQVVGGLEERFENEINSLNSYNKLLDNLIKKDNNDYEEVIFNYSII